MRKISYKDDLNLESMVKESIFWDYRADDYKKGADTILKKIITNKKKSKNNLKKYAPRHLPLFSYLLLISNSLENKLKGKIINRMSGSVKNGNINRKVTIHDLDKLSNRLGIKLSMKEEEVLKICSFILNGAKYPFPKKQTKTIDVDEVLYEQKISLNSIRNTYESICKKIDMS